MPQVFGRESPGAVFTVRCTEEGDLQKAGCMLQKAQQDAKMLLRPGSGKSSRCKAIFQVQEGTHKGPDPDQRAR